MKKIYEDFLDNVSLDNATNSDVISTEDIRTSVDKSAYPFCISVQLWFKSNFRDAAELSPALQRTERVIQHILDHVPGITELYYDGLFYTGPQFDWEYQRVDSRECQPLFDNAYAGETLHNHVYADFYFRGELNVKQVAWILTQIFKRKDIYKQTRVEASSVCFWNKSGVQRAQRGTMRNTQWFTYQAGDINDEQISQLNYIMTNLRGADYHPLEKIIKWGDLKQWFLENITRIMGKGILESQILKVDEYQFSQYVNQIVLFTPTRLDVPYGFCSLVFESGRPEIYKGDINAVTSLDDARHFCQKAAEQLKGTDGVFQKYIGNNEFGIMMMYDKTAVVDGREFIVVRKFAYSGNFRDVKVKRSSLENMVDSIWG